MGTAVLDWDENLSVGHPDIDRQHRELFACVRNLPRRDDPDFDQSMQFLLRYTFDHFRDEELLMRANDYPATREHMEAHRLLGENFDRHFHAYLDDQVDDQAFRSFLADWISRHILEEDRKLADFMREKAS